MKKYKIFLRALKDLYRLGKKHYLYYFIKMLAMQSMMFIGFIYMTRIIDALAHNQLETIRALVIQFLLISLALQCVQGIMQPLVDKEQDISERKFYAEASKKMFRMHFHLAESSEVRAQLENINQMLLSSQSSLPHISMKLKHALPSFISIVWGIILLYPLSTVDTSALPGQYWWINPWTIVIMFVVGISLSVAVQIRSSKKISEGVQRLIYSSKDWRKQLFYESELLEDVKSGKEIRLYQLSNRLVENIKKQTVHSRKMSNETYSEFKKTTMSSNILFQIISFMIYAFLGTLVLLGAMEVALIVQLSSALSQLIIAIPTCIQSLMMAGSDPEWLTQYYAFMDLPDEETIGSIPVEKRLDNKFTLSIENMSFAYSDNQAYVLKNINETFDVGKKYAIVGENGSGKTTFVKLLTRLYEPSEGKIKVNKIDTIKYDLKEYFNLFGIVFQDYHLLAFTIGQNIAVDPTYYQAKVMDTLDKVGLGDFIRTLPDQADTYLGTGFDDSGLDVSGGQEQKIAIARSLYKESPIIILDEPTAALDPMTEFNIYQNFHKLVENKTAFYISHRLSSSKFCDEILVFHEGEIIQRGTHEELVEENGKYQELWHAQAQYYQ